MTGTDNQMFHLRLKLGPESCVRVLTILNNCSVSCISLPSNIIRIKQPVLLLLASAILASDWTLVSQPYPLIGWSCPLLWQTSYKHSTLISVFGQYLLSREFKHNPFKNIFVRHSCHYPRSSLENILFI